jgi:hypothetical protein
LMTAFVIFCVPETKGVPIEELNEVIMQKVRGGHGRLRTGTFCMVFTRQAAARRTREFRPAAGCFGAPGGARASQAPPISPLRTLRRRAHLDQRVSPCFPASPTPPRSTGCGAVL